MLKIGGTAPDFDLVDQHGARHTLDTLCASGDVIVYFYPADFAPVCSAEACVFRDNYAGIEKIGIRIVGISPQGQASHASFATTFGIPFPLLADPRKQAVRAYGVDGPLGFGVRRATFLIGTDKVVKNRVVADLSVGSHAELLQRTLQAARAA